MSREGTSTTIFGECDRCTRIAGGFFSGWGHRQINQRRGTLEKQDGLPRELGRDTFTLPRRDTHTYTHKMGNIFSSMFGKLWGVNKEIRILILGLDGAGKTTILYKLQLGEVVKTKPTIGFNVETLQYKNISINMWDLGGQTSIRPYWRCYYANTAAVIFVVDSTDRDRLETARKELHMMLKEDELVDSALLVFANKQDQPGALTAAEVSKALGLVELKDRSWSIVASSAIKGEGLTEGLDWLIDVIKEEQM